MKLRKMLSVLLSVLLVCGVAPVMAFAVGGSCGSNVNWSLTNGTLSITGSGEMTNYTAAVSAPWEEYEDDIESVTVAGGVTNIGNYAFFGLENVSSVSLGTGLETIGKYAFSYCSALTELVIPSSLKNIVSSAFKDSGIGKITFLGSSLEAVGSNTFNGSGGLNGIKILIPEGFRVGSTVVACGKTGEAPFYNNYVGCTNGKATVFWGNYDGTVLETDLNVAPGAIPEYNGADPQKAADWANIYTFNGFEPTPAAVSANEIYIYTAAFTAAENTDHTYTMSWDDLKAALKTGGEITLQNDITAPEEAEALSVPKTASATLDLNGFTIDRGLDSAKKKGCVIEVLGSLTVTDTSADETGKITGGYTNGTGGGVWVRSTGSFTLAGGTVTGNTAVNVGGGVYLSGSGASFAMTGGAITGNTAKNGGGLGMDNSGNATVSDGTISGNTASVNGGGVWFGSGTAFTLSGGSVTGNTAAEQGGCIYIHDGEFDFTGGSVSGNTQGAGGDIAARSGSYLPTFDVTVNCVGGGTVTASKSPAGVDETVTLTVTSDPDDYKLRSLTVTADGEVIPTEKISENAYTFTMPASPVTVSAEFGELHRISTYIDVYNDPYNTYHGCTLTADKDYAIEGETVTLTLNLTPGYQYQGGDVNFALPLTQVGDNTFTFVMPDDTAEAAVHIRNAEYTVSLAGTASANVGFLLNDETRDNAPFPAAYNDMVTVIFYPYDQMISGMTYTYTEDGDTVTEEISYDWNGYSGAMEGNFRMPNSDVTVRVEYNTLYDVTEDWAHVENGLFSADTGLAAAGSTVTVYATPDQRYMFTGWHFTPDVTLTSDVTAANGTRIATFTMPESDVTFYATFGQALYDVTVSLPDGNGAIDAAAQGQAGEPFSFTVTPIAGYKVSSVKAVYGGTALSLEPDGGVYTFTMPYADVTLTAEFECGDAWSDLVSLIRAGGTVTLQRDYSASATDTMLEVPAGVTAVLDLNGHTINGDELSFVDVIVVEGALTLVDSGTSGKITGCDGDDVVYLKNGELEMTGGTIDGSNNKYCSVYVETGCTFRLTDGVVSGVGGDSAVSNFGTFDLRGGTVTGDSGDIVYNDSADMLMSGGSIRGSVGDESFYGFGVRLDDSNLFLSGAADIDVIEKRFEDDPETSADDRDYDVRLYDDSMIYVVGALDPNGPVLGIFSTYDVFAKGAAAAEGGEAYTITQSDLNRFKCTLSGYGVRLTDDNALEVAQYYNVTVSDTIENGAVSASAASTFEGAPVTLTVTPEEGYAIDSVTLNGTAIEPVDGQYGFAMPAEDVTVAATFVLDTDPDQEAADAVIAKIDAIGTVAYTEACKAKIDAASDAYAALTDAQKALVTNYETLTAAETSYAALQAQAEQEAADQEAADEVIAKIDAIGTVEYTEASKAKIDEASDAYDALTDAQKALVTNAGVLTEAIARYNELKAQAETPTDPTDPTDPGNTTEPTDPATPSGDNICKWDNVDHGTSFWGRLVRFFHSILYFFAHLFGRN